MTPLSFQHHMVQIYIVVKFIIHECFAPICNFHSYATRYFLKNKLVYNFKIQFELNKSGDVFMII